ncbi:MAG: hypothetical protein ACKPCM_11350, partial [Pseudanabaena sp.]
MIETESQQIKQAFSEESHLYTSDLERQISELDSSLPIFKQQIDQLIMTYNLLKESAAKADFYNQSPIFISITNGFDDVLKILGDRQDCINPHLKELLGEVIILMRQIIDKYCFSSVANPNWIELQNTLLTQINVCLVSKKKQSHINHVISIITNQNKLNHHTLHNQEDDVDSVNFDDFLAFNQLNQLEDADQLFLLPPDELDSSQSLENDHDSSQIEPLQSSFDLNQDFLPQLTNEKVVEEVTNVSFTQEASTIDTDTDFDAHLDNLINLQNQLRLTMPELLKDIFSLTDTDNLLEFGNEDETAIQGVGWANGEDDLNNHWHQFRELQSENEPYRLKEVQADVPTGSNQNLSVSASNHNVLVDEFTNSFNEPLSLDEEEVDLRDFPESIKSLDLLTDSVSTLESAYLSEVQPISIDQVQRESDLLLLDMLKSHDFSSSDVDTAIEESPIYLNKEIPHLDDTTLVDSYHQEIEATALTVDMTPIENHIGDISSLSNLHLSTKTNVNLTTDFNSYRDLDSGVMKPLDTHLTTIDHQDANIRIPLNYLELWEDLSEELLVRKGNLDVYLSEMRVLSHEALKQLQVLEPKVEQNQKAIANLQNTLKLITDILEHTEKYAYRMSHDAQNLRKNFRQVLKYPISGLVRKFPRILRDLSLEHGKQVELVVQGSEIGIDREIVDLLGEALELLMRNAFEHSIESNSERHQQGKSLQGKIEIVASQTADQTIIKISDD